MQLRPPIEIQYTAEGYIHLSEDVAREYFPSDTLVMRVRDKELWMLPTRGAAAGGLLLKQRNRAGDRSFLAAPYLPPDTTPANWPAIWDERNGALRVAFRTPSGQGEGSAIGAKAVVEPDRGRWVVYLEVGFAVAQSPGVRIGRRRIADYASEDQARVAAKWFERTADRDLPVQNGF
ncbi:MAG: hypothetical protein K2X35_26005 [Bryobacteraceae bacterium]|jgi:hypothetical protein|nr:hypothetical protein [Bryobacteraceae bacterium]